MLADIFFASVIPECEQYVPFATIGGLVATANLLFISSTNLYMSNVDSTNMFGK